MIKAYRKSTIFAETFLTYITHLNAFGRGTIHSRSANYDCETFHNAHNLHHNNSLKNPVCFCVLFLALGSFAGVSAFSLSLWCGCICTYAKRTQRASDPFGLWCTLFKELAAANCNKRVTRYWQKDDDDESTKLRLTAPECVAGLLWSLLLLLLLLQLRLGDDGGSGGSSV